MLAEAFLTGLELMPISEFFGDFGWGYSVLPYAPTRHYGVRDELKAFIDAAHGQAQSRHFSGECALLCRPLLTLQGAIPDREQLEKWQDAISRRPPIAT
ncbi:UNVERIFIED_ORG: hypothetical protein LHK14_23940 (plasmid) [Roseateles sp. XES5]|nr:hypothetical protein [Roseateles sp. XES5]